MKRGRLLINIYVFILGLIIGSFLGVIIDRLPTNQSIITGRSQCSSCNNVLTAIDLIPLISFIMLKGRCRHCSVKLSYRYPLFELLTGLSFLLAFNKFGVSYQCLIAMILTSILIVISFIDIDTMIIYDRFHFIILALGIIQIQMNHTTLKSSLVGMVIISIPYLILAVTTQGIGGGDVKLSASSGFLLNPKNTVLAFILSTLIGGVYGILLIVFKNAKHQDAIPFGPFLCIGIFTAFLYGDWIIDAYFSLF